MAGVNSKDNRGSYFFGQTSGKQKKFRTSLNAFRKGPLTASGGTLTEPGNGYKYHFFGGGGTFEILELGNGKIDLIMIAGGGGGGNDDGGGGGAGGMIEKLEFSIAQQTYPIVIGGGGSGGTYPTRPNNGSDTTAFSLTAKGGGFGGGAYTGSGAPSQPNGYWNAGNPGGSGGGSGDDGAGGAGVGLQPSQPTFGGTVTNYGRPGFAPELGNGPGGGNQNCGGGGASEGGDPSVTSAPGAPISFNGPNDRQGGDGQAFPDYPAPVLEPGIPSPRRSDWTSAVGPTGLFGGGGKKDGTVSNQNKDIKSSNEKDIEVAPEGEAKASHLITTQQVERSISADGGEIETPKEQSNETTGDHTGTSQQVSTSSTTSSSSSDTDNTNINVRFMPTKAWLDSVKGELPLTTIMRLLKHLCPQLQEKAQNTFDESVLLNFIQNTTLVGLLPVPHPIVIRKYQPNKYTSLWFSAFLWGVVFMHNQDIQLFDGRNIKLFIVKI